MAKRRNLKKEKAERNKAYARKFSKSRKGRFYRKRSSNNASANSNNKSSEEQNQNESNN